MESGLNLGVEWYWLALALAGAVVAGTVYNIFVSRVHDRAEQYTSLMVVAGVMMTLAFSAVFIGIADTLIVVAFFICTGIPMIVGEILREVRKRGEEREQYQQLLSQAHAIGDIQDDIKAIRRTIQQSHDGDGDDES